MGLCSCKAECNCAIGPDDPDNGLLLIFGDGNPESGGWKLKVMETPWSGSGDGAIEISQPDPDNAYGHSPAFALKTADSGTVALEVTPDGLVAHALNVSPAGGGTPPGVVEDYVGDVAPPGYVMGSGPNYPGYIPIDDAPNLFALVGHSESGGVDPGDGTFLVPYFGEKTIIGSGPGFVNNSVGGSSQISIAETNLPPHAHPASGSSGGDTSADGSHTHTPGSGSRSFVTAETATLDQVRVKEDGTGNVHIVASPSTDPGIDWAQLNNANTNSSGNHKHDTPAGGVTVGNTGDGTPITHTPYHRVTNKIIKI